MFAVISLSFFSCSIFFSAIKMSLFATMKGNSRAIALGPCPSHSIEWNWLVSGDDDDGLFVIRLRLIYCRHERKMSLIKRRRKIALAAIWRTSSAINPISSFSATQMMRALEIFCVKCWPLNYRAGEPCDDEPSTPSPSPFYHKHNGLHTIFISNSRVLVN